MSTYNRYNDEETSNNNAVIAVFAIVLAALVIIGFMMGHVPSQTPGDSDLNRNGVPRMESGR